MASSLRSLEVQAFPSQATLQSINEFLKDARLEGSSEEGRTVVKGASVVAFRDLIERVYALKPPVFSNSRETRLFFAAAEALKDMKEGDLREGPCEQIASVCAFWAARFFCTCTYHCRAQRIFTLGALAEDPAVATGIIFGPEYGDDSDDGF